MAGVNIQASLETIHRELRSLRDAGHLRPAQFKSIKAQLPHPDGTQSTYIDHNFPREPQPQGKPGPNENQGATYPGGGQAAYGAYPGPGGGNGGYGGGFGGGYGGQYPQQQQELQQNHEQMVNQMTQHAQDPSHPAHPEHKDHSSWVKSFAGKLGNAAVFGAGATVGSQIVDHII